MKDLPNYWLFQTNPKVFKLKDALRAEALETFPVKAHKDKIKAGDLVIFWQSGKRSGCFALGQVSETVKEREASTSEKIFYKESVGKVSRVSIKIDYNLWNKPITKEILPNNQAFQEFYAGIPGTNFKATKAQYETIKELISQLDILQEPQEEYIPNKLPKHPLNFILYGPPGTGKTFQTVNYALSIIENRSLKELALEERTILRDRFEKYLSEGQIAFVTFHQSFSYEDFVEGIKPVLKKKQVLYSIEQGIFKKIALKAQKCHDNQNEKKFVLIIDEINRGNVASIFGELITLIEKDKRSGEKEALQAILPYSKKAFSVPPNLHILATMNTTDRSVESLDIALRRRFTFVEMLPKPEMIAQIAKKPVAAGVDLAKLLLAINKRIEVLLDKDYCLGHSYFLNIETLHDLKTVFSKNIIPLLQEYFFNDYGKIGLVLGKDFLKIHHLGSAEVFANFEHDYATDLAEKKVYSLRPVGELTELAFIRIYETNYEKNA